ncbi:hypothetical protein SAMN05660313_01311 [Cellulophaga fucicola]|uniref:Uncharacterized protein n=1 Tax=Cellulophaga fucicola TaxID=76595 RepID=A0A1K1NQV1_9FLAO|nr:hypothetical protein SAMN05660313_01311 [Cellulophaga fucicola]
MLKAEINSTNNFVEKLSDIKKRYKKVISVNHLLNTCYVMLNKTNTKPYNY